MPRACFRAVCALLLASRCRVTASHRRSAHPSIPALALLLLLLLQLISSVVVIFRMLYIYLTRMSLNVFNCLPTEPPGEGRGGREPTQDCAAG